MSLLCNVFVSKSARVGIALGFAVNVIGAGCGMVHTHPDCDQVARQERDGATDQDIAKATGYNLADVQSCSDTTTSNGRETANNFQDRPQLPVIPNIPGSIGGGIFH